MNLSEQETNPLCDYRTIPLSKGQVAIVDSSDYEWLMQWKWCAAKDAKTDRFYAVRSGPRLGNGKRMPLIFMHKVILGANATGEGDHRDLDTLNNQRSNLRSATRKQNAANRGIFRTNKSGFLGVSWVTRAAKWRAAVKVNGTTIFCGLHEIPEDAARARDAVALKHFGEFARLNFPCQ